MIWGNEPETIHSITGFTAVSFKFNREICGNILMLVMKWSSCFPAVSFNDIQLLLIKFKIHFSILCKKLTDFSQPDLPILLFHSNLSTLASYNANYIDICLPDFYIQYLLKILCSSPPHLNTITKYLTVHILYHLITYLLTFSHSLDLFPKHIFFYPRNHSLIALPIASPPFYLQHLLTVLQPLSVPVSVISSTISFRYPLLKSNSLFGHRPTHSLN